MAAKWHRIFVVVQGEPGKVAPKKTNVLWQSWFLPKILVSLFLISVN